MANQTKLAALLQAKAMLNDLQCFFSGHLDDLSGVSFSLGDVDDELGDALQEINSVFTYMWYRETLAKETRQALRALQRGGVVEMRRVVRQQRKTLQRKFPGMYTQDETEVR